MGGCLRGWVYDGHLGLFGNHLFWALVCEGLFSAKYTLSVRVDVLSPYLSVTGL